MPIRTDKPIRYRKTYLASVTLRALAYKLRGDEEKMMTTIAEGFLRLGGVYIKFLQGVLLQIPIMKLWKSSDRLDVYEDVPIEEIDVEEFMYENMSPYQRARIKYVEPIPFASGSFGQVYKGYLYDDEVVIIKILRPHTRKMLRRDLRLIRLISRLVTSTFTNWSVDIKTLTKDFTSSTLRETDYLAEAKFGSELYKYFSSNTTIVIPKTYQDLSGKSIIVQEYIEGMSIAQLLKANIDGTSDYAGLVKDQIGSDLKVQLIELGFELNKAILSGGPIHGDPHPGNIRLLPNNRVALLDFGISAKPLKSPNAYYAMFKGFWEAEYTNNPDPGAMFLSYIRFFSAKLYGSMRVVSSYASKRNGKKIELDSFISDLGNKYFKKSVTDEQLKDGLDRIREGKDATDISVNNIINQDNRFQVIVKTKDGAVLRAMVTYMSLVSELGFRYLIPTVYDQTVVFVENNLPGIDKIEEPNIGLGEALETIYNWLEKVAKQDIELYRNIQGYLQDL
jgi:serine/threonine protein kinase